MRRTNVRGLVLLAVLGLALSTTVTAQEPQQTSPGSLIAYVAPSRDNQQIRVVAPDGTGDRVVWTAPAGTTRDDGIGMVSWRPDGAEIAFDSSHDALRSLLVRDLYAVRPSGTGLRRLIASPGPLNTAGMPTGTVTLRVENYTDGKELSVYLNGAAEPVHFTAPANTAWDVTFTNVPDLGPGVRQFARVLNRTGTIRDWQCWLDNAVFADVQPGQTVNAGTLTSLQDVNCAYAFRASWSADGQELTYFYREANRRLNRANNIWQIGANPPPTAFGEQLLDMNQFAIDNKLYLLARGPAAQADQVLFVRKSTVETPILLGAVRDLNAAGEINLGRCPRAFCEVLGLAWLPDGSGFVFSRWEQGFATTPAAPEGSGVYLYRFADQTLREVVRLPDEVAGRLALAPDGQQIVFERAARLEPQATNDFLGPRALCPCSLWLVNSDGSGLRQLVADGRAPSWSQVAPPAQAPLTPRLWLPLTRR